MLSIIILSSNTVLAMDGMHDHKSHNHDGHKDMTYVDGSKTKITDKMFSSFSSGLSNTQIVIVDVQGMVCDFCARGIEKTFNCLLYTSPSPRDVEESRMPSSA